MTCGLVGRSLLKKQVSESDWVSRLNIVSIQPACTNTHTHIWTSWSYRLVRCSCHCLSEYHLLYPASAVSTSVKWQKRLICFLLLSRSKIRSCGDEYFHKTFPESCIFCTFWSPEFYLYASSFCQRSFLHICIPFPEMLSCSLSVKDKKQLRYFVDSSMLLNLKGNWVPWNIWFEYFKRPKLFLAFL